MSHSRLYPSNQVTATYMIRIKCSTVTLGITQKAAVIHAVNDNGQNTGIYLSKENGDTLAQLFQQINAKSYDKIIQQIQAIDHDGALMTIINDVPSRSYCTIL